MGSKIHELHRGNKPANVRGHDTGNSSVSPSSFASSLCNCKPVLCTDENTLLCWFPEYVTMYMMLSILGSVLLSRSDSKSCCCRIGVVEGSWMIGIIDEIQMPTVGIPLQPMLVDTKTRSTRTVPSEAQKRNGRSAPYTLLS